MTPAVSTMAFFMPAIFRALFALGHRARLTDDAVLPAVISSRRFPRAGVVTFARGD